MTTADAMSSGRRRSGVSRDDVVGAALTIIDNEGLDRLTMRRLATKIGVGAATLYTVIPGKEELLEALADVVLRELDLGDPTGPPADQLVTLFQRWHEVLTRHPQIAQLSAIQPVQTPTALRAQEQILGVLRRGGLKPKAAASVYATLHSYVLGFTLTRISRLGVERHQVHATLSGREFPNIRATAPHFATHGTDEQQFLDGLRAIVAGVLPH